MPASKTSEPHTGRVALVTGTAYGIRQAMQNERISYPLAAVQCSLYRVTRRAVQAVMDR